jgi:two-component system, OmpR family, phosphate regulon sensor histidine kinase PhoR
MKHFRLSFRQTIIATFFLLFVVFILLIYPLIGWAFRNVASTGLDRAVNELIAKLQQVTSQAELVDELDQIHEYLFFRASLFNAQGDLLFDAAVQKEKKDFSQFGLPPELLKKILDKKAFSDVEMSKVFQKKLIYDWRVFENGGQVYIMRGALPFEPIKTLKLYFGIEFLFFCLLCLLFFSGCLWLVFHRINYPTRQMIQAILPFQRGQVEFISPIRLPKSIDQEDPFYQLAETLNALSERIRTQIRHITEERNEKEAVLESLGEGVVAIDKDMRIRYVNYIGSRMFGFPRKQLAGKSFEELASQTASPLLEKCHVLLETCQKKMTILTDSIFIGDGKKLYLDLIAAPKPMQNGAILVLQDKSSHYKVLEMGKDFVANASHELRTPITIIRGFAETLHDLPELPREMVSDITEKIVRNCQRMDNLVKNLLTLADLENIPESRFQECDLIALIENSKQVVLSIYEDAQVRIEKTKETIAVDADPDILELAIINLVDNAAKYSSPPAQITIKVDQIGDEAKIIISDKGIGIPPEDIEHIFERFYTVNKAHSRRLGGAGLGLSIVKTIIEKHHGTIAVASMLKHGTTFTISLPIHRVSFF